MDEQYLRKSYTEPHFFIKTEQKFVFLQKRQANSFSETRKMVKVTQKKNFVISRLLSAEALVSFTQKMSNMIPSWSGWSGDG